MTQTIEQFSTAGGPMAQTSSEYYAKQLEQLSARVAELEAENARLKSMATTKGAMGLLADQLNKLTIAQADNKRLRDWISKNSTHSDSCDCLCLDDDGKLIACACGLTDVLAQPSDTSALDAYVAEKVNSQRLDAPAMVGQGRFMTGVAWRTVIKAAQVRYEQEVTPSSEALRLEKVTETNILIKLRDDQIATLTRQRDLAIEALKWAADVLPPIDPGELGVCVCPVCRALEAIKESEAGRVLD